MYKINYANGLAEMIPWNLTTVIRTHYRMKPHIMDKKVQELIKSPKVNHVFYALEDDFELVDFKQKMLKVFSKRNSFKRGVGFR